MKPESFQKCIVDDVHDTLSLADTKLLFSLPDVRDEILSDADIGVDRDDLNDLMIQIDDAREFILAAMERLKRVRGDESIQQDFRKSLAGPIQRLIDESIQPEEGVSE